MPTLPPAALESFARRLLEAVGTPEDIAACVAAHLVDANLKGVDSHGVQRLPDYLAEIARGDIQPAARPSLAKQTSGTAAFDGGRGFGIHALDQVAGHAIELAKTRRIAAVGLTNAAHTGRIGAFAAKIAEAGHFALILGGGAHRVWATVAPHGGREAVMSTNPYALALPGAEHGPVVVDFATSAAARGKIAAYQAAGKAIPEDWVLDRHGQATSDPAALFEGGVQLPMAGHKGTGLGLIAELLCFAMLPDTMTGPHDLNWLVLALEISAFRDQQAYAADCRAFLDKLKAIPPAPGFAEVLIPGEPEAREEERRREEGIPLPEATWAEIQATAERVGVAVE
ncbi:MAG: Ldh family oxidoreductase [Pseudomonadota bacterium]